MPWLRGSGSHQALTWEPGETSELIARTAARVLSPTVPGTLHPSCQIKPWKGTYVCVDCDQSTISFPSLQLALVTRYLALVHCRSIQLIQEAVCSASSDNTRLKSRLNWKGPDSYTLPWQQTFLAPLLYFDFFFYRWCFKVGHSSFLPHETMKPSRFHHTV